MLLKHEALVTQHEGHATILARQATSDVVVAVGGDGTVNEVANGIFGSAKTLAVIPVGSGNDFVKSIGIPLDFSGAFQHLLADKRQAIDCGSVRCRKLSEQTNSTESIFVNAVGIGFDAAVAERTTHIHNLSGTALYLAAVFQTLGKYRSASFTITIDSNSSKSRNLLIAIGNGRCAGGGFYLTPNASVSDGLLDVCTIEEMSVPRILHLMPKVMKGKHAGLRGVQMTRASEIDVTAPEEFYVHADGQIVGRGVNEVHIEVRRRVLSVVVGDTRFISGAC